MEPGRKEQARRTLLLEPEEEQKIEVKQEKKTDFNSPESIRSFLFTNRDEEVKQEFAKITQKGDSTQKLDIELLKFRSIEEAQEQSEFEQKNKAFESKINKILEEKKEDSKVQTQQEIETTSNQETFSLPETEINEKEEKRVEETPKKQKSLKLRKRLFAIVYCLVIGICGGWAIGNAIAINNEATLMQETENYVVRLGKMIYEISNLDNAVPDNSENTLNPIESIITIQPEKTVTPQEYEKQTNWFDNFCNWLSHIFRR